MDSNGRVRALVWDENPAHAPKELYPDSIAGAIVKGLHELEPERIAARHVNLDMPHQGVGPDDLENCDVLFWWGHARHHEVTDETAWRVRDAVRERGMGFVALHSAHYARTFQRVLDAAGHLNGGWRECDPPDTEEITVCAPGHPIARGVSGFTLSREEMYGAPFDVPPPTCLVLQSYFPVGGEYFPSGMCWTVGRGKTPGFTSGPGGGVGEGSGLGRVFYFRPGHETHGTYYHPEVKRILANAALWCAHAEI